MSQGITKYDASSGFNDLKPFEIWTEQDFIAALICLATFLLITLIALRFKKRKEELSSAPKQLRDYFKELLVVVERAKAEEISPRAATSLISTVLREFISERFKIQLLEKTSFEAARELERAEGKAREVKEEILQLIANCEKASFASSRNTDMNEVMILSTEAQRLMNELLSASRSAGKGKIAGVKEASA